MSQQTASLPVPIRAPLFPSLLVWSALGMCLGAVCISPQDATAQPRSLSTTTTTTTTSSPPPTTQRFRAGAGVKLALVSNVLSPADPSPTLNPPLPGFTGQSGGVFLTGQALYLDTIGIESGIGWVRGYGEGTFTFLTQDAAVRVPQRLESNEIHIPLLLKAQIPFWTAQPFLSLGITPVVQTSATYDVDRDDITTTILDPPADSYVMYTLALGTHVDLDHVRFPVELRAQYAPRSRDPNARTVYSYSETEQGLLLDSFSVRALWEAQFMILVGVEYAGWKF